MSRLFASYFTVPVLDADAAPAPTYDEERCLSLDSEGQVFVERPVAGIETGRSASGTETLTHVRAERPDILDDFSLLGTETRMKPTEREHRVELPALETTTKIRGERDATSDSSDLDMLATETKAHGERPDVSAAELEFGTKTAVPREGEDRACEVFIGTETAIGREPGDFGGLSVETHTLVRGEGEDVQGLGGPAELDLVA